MAQENKMQATANSVEAFLSFASEKRQKEASVLIEMMQRISGEKPVLWGDSIIGFGTEHYRYDSGREGDMPRIAFSPRKARLTLYFDRFDRYKTQLEKLGKHKTSVACLYINKLDDVDLTVLEEMIRMCWDGPEKDAAKVRTPEEYIAAVPEAARAQFDALRRIARDELPDALEVVSYGILGYRTEPKRRARVYISGWKDHVALYPVPHDEALKEELAPYVRGKGTVWFSLHEPLPEDLIRRTICALMI